MSHLRKLFLIGALSVWSWPALAEGFGYLESWVGSYPVRESGGTTQRLLDDRRLRSSVDKLIGKRGLTKIGGYDQSLPIRNIDGFIVVNRCKPRNCPPERAILVLDTKKDRLWVGFFERYAAKVVVTWYSNVDDYYYLPNAILTSFSDKQFE